MTAPRRRAVRDPYGLMPAGSPVGPVVAFVGLIVVAFLTVGLLQGRLPFVMSSGGGGGGGGAAGETPAPSGVIVDPRADVPGSIVYAKAGSVFVQSGKDVRQLTEGPGDSMPAWSADGAWVYFVRSVSEPARFPIDGAVTAYQLTYPLLMRVPAAGGTPEQLASGKFSKGSYSWFFWIRQPAPDPADGNRIAVTSDGPDPVRSDTVLQMFDVTSGKFSVVKGLTETPPLGHQDPTWRPDGGLLIYTRNDRDGSRGTPAIWQWDPSTGKSRALTGPGYLQPSWSPDGRYIAATKTSLFGTDVIVVDATSGADVLRVTSDGASFAPAWSPRGDAIAFLHVKGLIVDLRMVSISGSGASMAVGESLDLTTASGLDGTSRPSWFIPRDQLPPSPAPSASASGGNGGPSAAGSGATGASPGRPSGAPAPSPSP